MHSLCKNSFLSTALAASLSLSAACGGGQADGPVEPTTPGVSSARVGDPSSKPVVVLNDYTANTVWGSLPLFGRAPADARLVYGSPLVGTQILTVDGDGHFCIDVALQDGANPISIQAENEAGTSNPIEITVFRSGTSPTDSLSNEPINLVEGAFPLTTNFDVFEGDILSITDGDDTTFAKAYNAGNGGSEFTPQVRLRLNPEAGGRVQSINFISPAACEQETYWLYLSESEDPGKLVYQHGESQGEWVQIASSRNSAANKTFLLPTGPFAKWVAVWVDDAECTPFYSWGHYAISEIQVMGVDYVDPFGAQPGAPSCE